MRFASLILSFNLLAFSAGAQIASATELGPDALVKQITDQVMAEISRLSGQVEAGVYNERPPDA